MTYVTIEAHKYHVPFGIKQLIGLFFSILINFRATQIALGCMDGCVWIMADFSVDISAPYVNIGHPITHLRRIPSKHNHVFSVTSGEENGLVDLLLCGGHFHSIKVLQYGKVKLN